MARGKKQEMEEGLIDVASGVSKSSTAVNANAKAGEPIDTSQGNWEDLGGPTPQHYKVDDDSAKLKPPGGHLQQVSDVVTNRKGQPLKQGDEAEVEEEVIEEVNI